MGPNKSSGAKGGKGGKGGGKGGKGKSKANYYSSRRPVGGKGIFVTTVRGKESRCAGEMYDLLDEVSHPQRATLRPDRSVGLTAKTDTGRRPALPTRADPKDAAGATRLDPVAK